jgi:hypothetical protein
MNDTRPALVRITTTPPDAANASNCASSKLHSARPMSPGMATILVRRNASVASPCLARSGRNASEVATFL